MVVIMSNFVFELMRGPTLDDTKTTSSSSTAMFHVILCRYYVNVNGIRRRRLAGETVGGSSNELMP